MVKDPKAIRVGEWVEVRSMEQILTTLDGKGSIYSMPFMPEMAQFCGKRFKVVKSAHKTCDPTGGTNLRSMSDTVHLETRCDGSGHDGCEARCLIFWKTEWLKKVEGDQLDVIKISPPVESQASQLGIKKLEELAKTTDVNGDITYMCQATEIVVASDEIPRSNVKNFLEDLSSKNISMPTFSWHFLRAASATALSKLARVAKLQPPGQKNRVKSKVASNIPLNLQPGEYVEVMPAKHILSTLNKDWKNRGLLFEKEMLQYCGKQFRVLGRVNRLIDEKTGKMLKLKNDCIILQGIVCSGLSNRFRLFCPRSPYLYWREAWLRRIDNTDRSN